MAWLNRMLYRISAYCRCRIIGGSGNRPYLERYHLMCLPFGYRVYLHRFVDSDPGRGLHNHPWSKAISLVLCGSYQETRMLGDPKQPVLTHRQLRAGSFNLIAGNVFHRIDIAAGTQCWSLFIHAATIKSWGFIQQHRYYDHDDLTDQASNPLWWKHAQRPIHSPQMRLPCAL